ncbi:hypothetical protein DXG01_008002 [Tephrocybe rancida]|nr:hypothetical protein DXG01_008002 [Tephrocybe rancida]
MRAPEVDNMFAYILRYVLPINVFFLDEMTYLMLVECASELFNASRLCPANSEISLLNGKASELERDLELERRKIREFQDASRDREKEYQKLKLQLDKFKRKALLAPHPSRDDGHPGFANHSNEDPPRPQQQRPFGMGVGMNNVNLSAVVGGMEASGIQRTPLVKRTMPFVPQAPGHANWGQQQPPQGHVRNKSHRQPFAAADRSYRSTTDQSDSANEVENILAPNPYSSRGHVNHGGWSSTPQHPLRPIHQNVQGMLPVQQPVDRRRSFAKKVSPTIQQLAVPVTNSGQRLPMDGKRYHCSLY